MGNNECKDDSEDEKIQPSKSTNVVSSKKKDPAEALEYWTPENIEKAQPVPQPKKRLPPESEPDDGQE